MTHKIRGVRVEQYAYYVNTLHQIVGLETWIWRQIVTSQRMPTTNKWPPYATDWNPPHEKFLRTPLNKYARNGTEKKRQSSNTREQTRAHPIIAPQISHPWLYFFEVHLYLVYAQGDETPNFS